MNIIQNDNHGFSHRYVHGYGSYLLGLLTLAMSVIFQWGCGGSEPETARILRPVRFQQVFATGGTRVRTFSGVAQAAVESRLSFKVGGTINRLHVKVGDNVEPGTLIAELDPKDFELQVDEAEAALEQARAGARRAAAEYDRIRQLYENRNASRSDLDAARAADESAKAQVRATEKKLELAASQLGYTKLRAAVGGAIASVDADINENVKPGDRIAVLTSGQRLEVKVSMPGLLIAQIREGDQVEVKFDAQPDRPLKARVTEVGVAATGTLATFPVTVLLEQSDNTLRPGMSAEVAFTFRSGDERERFIVPPVAVAEDKAGRHVFVVNRTGPETGIVERRAVVVGELTSDGLEVFEGLLEGDLLVTAGVTKIHDSMEVKLPKSAENPS